MILEAYFGCFLVLLLRGLFNHYYGTLIIPPPKKIENLFISIYTIYYIQTKVHLKIIKEEKVPTKRVSISGETLCYDNRRLIGTPLIVIARQSQKNRD